MHLEFIRDVTKSRIDSPVQVKGTLEKDDDIESLLASREEVDTASKMIEEDPVLQTDDFATKVVADRGLVVFKSGKFVIQDLGDFLAARKAVINNVRVDSRLIDNILTLVAQGPEYNTREGLDDSDKSKVLL